MEVQQHRQVQPLCGGWHVPRWKDHLHQEDAPVVRHRPSAVREERDRPLVIPVVHDVLQDVGVTTGWHGVEEVAGGCRRAALGEMRVERSLRARDHLRQIEEHAGRVGMAIQDQGQEGTVPATNVNNPSVGGEVMRGHDRGGLVGRSSRHEVVENRCQVRLCVEIVEPGFAVDVLKGGPTRPHAVLEIRPRQQVRLAPGEQCPGAGTVGRIAAQGIGHVGQREPAIRVLAEHLPAGEGAHDAIQRTRVGIGCPRKVADRHRPVVEQVGDPELGGEQHGMDEGEVVDQLSQGGRVGAIRMRSVTHRCLAGRERDQWRSGAMLRWHRARWSEVSGLVALPRPGVE